MEENRLNLIKQCLIGCGLQEEQIVKFIGDCLAAAMTQNDIIIGCRNYISIPEWLKYYDDSIAYLNQMDAQKQQEPVQVVTEQQVEPVQEVQEVQTIQVQEEVQVVHEEVSKQLEVSQVQEEPVVTGELVSPNLSQQEVISKVETKEKIAQLQEEIEKSTKELLNLKRDLTEGGPYLNDSYQRCPSFKNLIEPIQKAIIAKRHNSINTKWYEKYRPELVEEILFPNQPIKETIYEYVRNGYIGGHCMFYGDGGVGKTTTNIVLMNAVLKNATDRFVLDRKIDSVDNLKGFLNKKAIGKQKIVIAEEFDRLSHTAQTELKNGLLEKYEDTIFLASTNKIHKIDEALLSRFTLVAKFENADAQELINKCKFILANERIVYKDEDVLTFIENNKVKGIRTILNNLQLSCYDGVFDPNRTSYFIGSSGTEFDLIQWTKQYINGFLLKMNPDQLYGAMFGASGIEGLEVTRKGIIEMVLYNYNLNYDYVFTELLADQELFGPAKNIIEKYYQDIDVKKIKSMHYESMLNELNHMVYEFRNIQLNWNHKQLTDVVKISQQEQGQQQIANTNV